MAVEFCKKYRLDENFDIDNRESQYLYIDFENVNWLRTNEVGHDIIKACDGDTTMEDIIRKISEENGFSVTTLKNQFESFLESVVEKGIIIEEGKERVELKNVQNKYPGTIWIHVTEKCNLECPFCYSESDITRNTKIDCEKLLERLALTPDESKSGIIISGGEPFLYSDLPKLVKGLKEIGYGDITIITNGTVGEEMYKEVIPYITNLQISIDGTRAEIHDKTRGKGSFDRTIKKFELARECGVKRIVISFTPTSNNIEDLPNLPEFVRENKIDSIHVTRLMPVGRGNDNKDKLSLSNDDYNNAILKLIGKVQKLNRLISVLRDTHEHKYSEEEKSKFIGVTFAGDQSRKITTRYKRSNCSLGCGLISIDARGDIWPCPSMHVEGFKMGNIFMDEFESIISGGKEIGDKLSVDAEGVFCNDCKLRYFCGGGCRACALRTDGVKGADPLCEEYKEGIIESMWALER